MNFNVVAKAAITGFMNNKKQVARTIVNIMMTIVSAIVANYINEQKEQQ